jgi:hypothetical protein
MHAVFGEDRRARHAVRFSAAVPGPLRREKQYRSHV